MGINSSRIRGNFKQSKSISRQSIMKVNSYTFGDASNTVINNIDEIIEQTIEFLTSLQSIVIQPIMSGNFVESKETKEILQYLVNLKLVKYDEIEITNEKGKMELQKKYRFVSTSYRDKVDNANNIGPTYDALITQYITLLQTLVPYYSQLTLGDLMTDNDDHKDINSMKEKINSKLTQMTNYIKFFHFDSYIVDYSRYVYMIYAIQMFKELDDIYDILKIKSDLTTLDSSITLNQLDGKGNIMDNEIGNLSKLINDEGKTAIEITDMDGVPTTQNVSQNQETVPDKPPSKINFAKQVNNDQKIESTAPLNFSQQQKEKQQGGNIVQVTINKLKAAFEQKENDFKEDREALIVFFNAINMIIKKASDEIKEIYFKKYEDILTDKTIVASLNNISNKISSNTNRLSQVFNEGVTEEEKNDLASKISDGKNLKVTDRDLGALVTLNKKIRNLNEQTKNFINPVL